MCEAIFKSLKFYQMLALFCMLSFMAAPGYASVVFETNFDSNADWNSNGQFDGKECSPLGVGSPSTCAASSYPENWSGFRSVPGYGGLNPVVSIATPPYGGDHSTGSGKTAVIRQESVSGVNWPGDGMIIKYLGSEYSELYVQFWVRSQSAWQMPAVENYFKFFRIQRKGNLATNWFDEFTQGVRPSPSMLVQPKNSTYGWRHMDPLRGYPDDNGTVFRGVCTDTTVWNGRTVCNYGVEQIEDPYEYSTPTKSPSDVGELFDGSWHKVVYHIKMNTVGANDGILQMWIDGVQKTNATKLRWQASGTPVGFNLVVFGGNGNNTFSSSPADQWYAIDDVVVSTTPIAANYVIGGSSTADTSAPTVSISSPTNNAAISGTVTISTNASDTVGVSKVEFYVNGSVMATDTSTPYVYSWDTSAVAAGTYSLMAKAYDAAGNVAQSGTVTVSVVKDTTIPTVSLTAPANNVSVSGTVTITASAADNVGINKVEYYKNNVLLAAGNVAPYSSNWNTLSEPNGTFMITARAYDAAGNVGQSAAVAVTVNNTVADTTTPTASISSPAANATVSGTVNITASASDNAGVSKVEFYVEGVLKATGTAAPYSYSWDTTSVTNGARSLTVKAYDAAGNAGQSPAVSVTVNNIVVIPPGDTIVPTVSITAPAPGATVSRTINIAATANDNVGVKKVELYVNGVLSSINTTSNPYYYSWNTAGLANGSYILTTKAYDAAGNVGQSSAVAVTVNNTVTPVSDTTAPTISITSPVTNATVRRTVYITASASDNVGVKKVEYYVNGVLKATDTAAPYSYGWNSRTVANGIHTITAKAYDAAGNAGQSAAVNVTVINR